jgi:hypothetical protein
MKNIIKDISNKEYNSATEAISEALSTILEKKMVEMKKMMMAKEQTTMTRKAFDGNPGARAEKLYRDVVEDSDNPNMNSEKETNKLAEIVKPDSRKKLTNYDWEKDSKAVEASKDPKFVSKMIDKWGHRGGAWFNHPTLKESELDEARIKIVKARVRGGKIQRRKKVSNVAGYTLRGGQLKRMSPMERRKRKLGQRRGKIKRRAKLQRSLVKRKRSLRKRQSIGLK